MDFSIHPTQLNKKEKKARGYGSPYWLFKCTFLNIELEARVFLNNVKSQILDVIIAAKIGERGQEICSFCGTATGNTFHCVVR